MCNSLVAICFACMPYPNMVFGGWWVQDSRVEHIFSKITLLVG